MSALHQRFSAAAHSYGEQAELQAEVAAETALLCLQHSPAPKQILDIGCGTGLLTRALAKRYPYAKITALDPSSAMLQVGRDQLADFPHINWLCTGLLDAPLDSRSYDLICSSSALHWVTPYAEAFAKIAAALKPGGQVVAAIMQQGTLKELHQARKWAAPDKPVTPLPTLAETQRACEHAGLCIRTLHARTRVTYQPDAKSALRHLHLLGVTGGRFSRKSATSLTRGEMGKLTQQYQELFGDSPSTRVPLTWRLGFLVAETRIF